MIIYRQISWGQFGMAAGISTLLYYAVVGWMAYRNRLPNIFHTKQNQQESADQKTPELLGASVAEKGISHLDADELVAGPARPELPGEELQPPAEKKMASPALQRVPQSRGQEQVILLGAVADAMEEIKALLDAAKDAGENREALLQTLQLLTPKLAPLAQTNYPQALNLFLSQEIKKRFAFRISASALLPLWNSNHILHLKK